MIRTKILSLFLVVLFLQPSFAADEEKKPRFKPEDCVRKLSKERSEKILGRIRRILREDELKMLAHQTTADEVVTRKKRVVLTNNKDVANYLARWITKKKIIYLDNEVENPLFFQLSDFFKEKSLYHESAPSVMELFLRAARPRIDIVVIDLAFDSPKLVRFFFTLIYSEFPSCRIIAYSESPNPLIDWVRKIAAKDLFEFLPPP